MDTADTHTGLSYRLSKAVARGRENNGKAENREAVLARLLMKRAAAHRAGLSDLEAIMRRQIEWSLPIVQDADSKKIDLAA